MFALLVMLLCLFCLVAFFVLLKYDHVVVKPEATPKDVFTLAYVDSRSWLAAVPKRFGRAVVNRVKNGAV